MTINTALTELGTILEAETSCTKVYVNPPESLSEFPCFVLVYVGGSMTLATAGDLSHDILTAQIALYVTRQSLPTSSTKVRPYIQEVRDALTGNATLNGSCFRIGPLTNFEGPGAMNYATDLHYGIRFECTIEFKDAVTYAA